MGKVIAVCISEKKGTQKKNVGTAQVVEDWGIQGDAHAGKWHRQVSLLSSEKINAFRAKGAEVEDGAFGENLVVEGIDFAKLPVGTRFRCGEVVLELTQIGKECHNGCAIFQKMGECIMPREGVFTRVLKGGKVSVGDEMTVDKAMIFDTHAHYDDEAFDEDRKELLDALPAQGIGRVINVCAEVEGWDRTVDLMERYPYIYGAVGVHPDDVGALDEEKIQRMHQICRMEKTVAVGEIGLDYYWDTSTKATQEIMLRAQLELALELDLPVIIHDREAHGDSLRIVCDYPGLHGVFHCFSGSVEMARELLRRGWYLGFDGPITYKNAVKALDVIAACPADRVLLETDSPYLAPVPNRGKRNDSRNLPYIAARIAEIKGMTTDQVAEVTLQNGKQLFNL